jgi:hypothetical protein
LISEAVVQIAVPVVALPVAGITGKMQPLIEFPLSVKVTVPESFVAPAGAVTVAVKFTDWLTFEVLPADDDMSEVLLAAGLTVCVTLFWLPL